ncbi:leucine-rich repeat receptor-like serine/threonine-protein kinase SKM1, partial [Raphanus sativus]|uniref:Leucine-rich repeat receptor-like serine/threonine-protein kinase SKM1 n=1 Tax=Raphanus sativus TaxID=3726 RepID=A0A9W3CSP1_RAPSA
MRGVRMSNWPDFSGPLRSGLSPWSPLAGEDIMQVRDRDVTNLTVLDLSTNNLTGKLPDTLCDSGQLTKLILFSNSLHGVIPQSLGKCQSLERVRLQNNNLSGKLPRGFNELQLVNFLDLSNNNLRGNLGIFNMPQLEMLNLGKNKFSGELPDLSRSKRLKKLDLSGNIISGLVPVELMTFTELMNLDISYNEITGVIPSELSSCKKLVSLDMSHNNLTGEIPSSFSDFPVLSDLDLSGNQLSGEIPKNLGNIESLVQVNISHNHLHGSLPLTGAFLAINATAVAGNNNLCGENNVSIVPPCSVVRKRSTNSWWFVVMLTFVAFLAVVLSGFFISLVFQMKHNVLEVKKVEQEDGTKWEIQFFDSRFIKSLTVNAILSSLKNENIFVDKNGVKFVIKKVKKYDSLPNISEIVKLPEHRNIIKLVVTCRLEEVAYLIHENVE